MEKYKKDTELQIPIEQRQKLNEKILYLVENHEAELYGITPEDIFNVYTGNGGYMDWTGRTFKIFMLIQKRKKKSSRDNFLHQRKYVNFLFPVSNRKQRILFMI